jgi:mannan endo-1,4-beta-mannosidase
MKSVEDRLRAAIRSKVAELGTDLPPLRLPARRRGPVVLAYGGGENDRVRRRPWHRWLAPAASAVLVGAIAVAGVTFAVSQHPSPASARPPAARPPFYLGVFAAGSPPGYGPVAGFARVAGMQPDLVEYACAWLAPFDTAFAVTLRDHHAVPIVDIDPTGVSLTQIAAGYYDAYLSTFAARVAAFGHPVVIALAPAMNADWSTWGYRHVPAATFVAAYRHVVSLFRHRGADNVAWLWTIQAGGPGTSPPASWWPGSNYVTWIGIDGFYYRRSDTFGTIFGPTIGQVRELTNRPILITQTAVSPHAGQPAKIHNLFSGIEAYGLLGLVWFNQDQHSNGRDWQIQDNSAAERSFQRAASALIRH